MKLRHHSRSALALVAAYAFALQAILLAVAGPVAGAGDTFAAPICSHSGAGGTGSAPAGRGCDCLANCLAGCRGGAAAPAPGTTLIDTPYPLQTTVAALVVVPASRSSAGVAHRSRAPPLG
jgi:hypothetical protein